MKYQHKQLASGKWEKLTFLEQMANIGSEVGRTITWKNKNRQEYSDRAFERALELLHLTIADIKNKQHLRGLTRLRETLIDYFKFDNEFNSSDKLWQNYFHAFNFAARRNY